MTTTVEKAIYFRCEYCDHPQYHRYSLEHGWHDDRAVMQDNILCEKCGRDNHIIEEL